jgi:hypothetical protein
MADMRTKQVADLVRGQLEDQAEAAVRGAVREVLGMGAMLHPADAGSVAMAREAVRLAWAGGREEAVRELADAYCLYIGNDDLDVLRDAFTERLPEGWAAPEPQQD